MTQINWKIVYSTINTNTKHNATYPSEILIHAAIPTKNKLAHTTILRAASTLSQVDKLNENPST